MNTFVVWTILAIATVLLLSERLRADLVAMLTLGALILARLVDTGEALSGFSNPATVTVAAMFLVSAGLKASGVVGYLGDRLLLHGPSSPPALLILVALIIAPVSAFINNTAVVAIFLPLVQRACRGNQIKPGQLLMPVSFFAMLGGSCTLIGTTTNLVVSSIAVDHGVPGFRMFEFTGIGLILLAAGAVYLLVIGSRLLPHGPAARESGSEPSEFDLHRYLSEVVVLEDSPLVGKSLEDARLGERYQMDVFGHSRNKVLRSVPGGYETLEAGDTLLVKAPAESLLRLGDTAGLAVRPGRHPDAGSLRSANSVLLEAVVTPNSDLDGRTLKGVDFRRRFGATTLAIRRGEDIRAKIGRLRLRVGDELLIVAPRRAIPRLKEQTSFVILQELDVPVLNPFRALLAFGITAAVVAAVTVGLYPLAVAAVVGAVMMVVSGCLPVRKVYQEIEWPVIFLLAGLIPLGVALETTGAAAQAVDAMLGFAGGWGPPLVLSAFFLMAALLTGFMSNAATAVLLAPLAISCAGALDVDPRPFLVALTLAASAAFWTPIGYQTNLLVYGAGNYRFLDFVRVGGPLTLIYWGLASVLIPRFFPFHP